jgi:hypothetical protein
MLRKFPPIRPRWRCTDKIANADTCLAGPALTNASALKSLRMPRTVKMAAKWLGPCAAGQRPGDMPGGQKMNILDLQGAMPGAAGGAMAPHQ